MTRPNGGDAALLIQLAQLHMSCGLPEALSWMWSDRFPTEYAAFVASYPPGSDGDSAASRICRYFDTVGSLHKHGLVHEELVLDWLTAAEVWDRIKAYALGQRRATGIPTLWSNFEGMATAHKRLTREYST